MAWQLLLQPFFAKSNRKFTSQEVLLLGSVVSDQSGNEQEVNWQKYSSMLAHGMRPVQDLNQFADFMYRPCLIYIHILVYLKHLLRT